MQRFAIAVVAAQKADVYMIDEPSSYLDVRQRLKAAQVGFFTPSQAKIFSNRRARSGTDSRGSYIMCLLIKEAPSE